MVLMPKDLEMYKDKSGGVPLTKIILTGQKAKTLHKEELNIVETEELFNRILRNRLLLNAETENRS